MKYEKQYVTRVFPRGNVATCFPAFYLVFINNGGFLSFQTFLIFLRSFCSFNTILRGKREKRKHKNTKYKTLDELTIFQEYLDSINEPWETADILSI